MLNFGQFENHYYNTSGKFADNWTETINFLPFLTNISTSLYDKTCGLSGVTGEFFRKWSNVEIKPISNFKDNLQDPVQSYLRDKGKMNYKEITHFMKVVKDIIYPESRMNVVDISFLPYIPLVDDKLKDSRTAKKYIDGQKKLSEYLYSMLSDDKKTLSTTDKQNINLFSTCIKSGLERGCFANKISEEKYYILPLIKGHFNIDIKWLLDKEDYLVIKYIDLFLHFYICLSLSQTIGHIIHWQKFTENDWVPFYYMLTSEHASQSRQVVQSGWNKWITKTDLQKLFGRAQALDIFNTLAGEKVGFYNQLIQKLGNNSFPENKNTCELVLKRYFEDKKALLSDRDNIDKNKLIKDFDCTTSSYEEFFKKLTQICTILQSPDFNSRFDRRVSTLFEIKFLDKRRGMNVLTLDDDILVFLIAMVTKERKTKLDNMYKQFNNYGIFFDISTRTAIENYLKKMNLLERKSDSGEAQYVTVIL